MSFFAVLAGLTLLAAVSAYRQWNKSGDEERRSSESQNQEVVNYGQDREVDAEDIYREDDGGEAQEDEDGRGLSDEIISAAKDEMISRSSLDCQICSIQVREEEVDSNSEVKEVGDSEIYIEEKDEAAREDDDVQDKGETVCDVVEEVITPRGICLSLDRQDPDDTTGQINSIQEEDSEKLAREEARSDFLIYGYDPAQIDYYLSDDDWDPYADEVDFNPGQYDADHQAQLISSPSICSGNMKMFLAHYELEDTISHGGYGAVFYCRDLQTQELRVVKMITIEQSTLVAGEPTEVTAMRLMDHPGIGKFIEWFESATLTIIIMPFTASMNLRSHLKQTGELSEEFIKKKAIKILPAIKHLHENGFIHQDVKPDNVLLNLITGETQLIDFGEVIRYEVSNQFQKSIECTSGTDGFVAPEYDSKQLVHGPEIDVYSFGALLFALYYGLPPTANVDAISQAFGKRPSSYNLIKLIFKCLDEDPDRRPSIEEIQNSDWLRDPPI